ncbi:MAG TPA: F0F1 ATP synthase subunit beta, partial [Bacteroidetes bacterium]|nr:F0F1 ATP synthase subunit beta [Bacteroidota bacterium]
MNEGRIVQIIGPVIDIDFSGGTLPSIMNAIRIPRGSEKEQQDDLIVEVQQHLGDNRVRTVAMDSTDGLPRGIACYDTGGPITIPVGPAALGRLINVLGQGIDELGPIKSDVYYPIHRPAPEFDSLSSKKELFETGLTVIDLLEPYSK